MVESECQCSFSFSLFVNPILPYFVMGRSNAQLTSCCICLDSAALLMLNLKQIYLVDQIQTRQTGGQPYSDTFPNKVLDSFRLFLVISFDWTFVLQKQLFYSTISLEPNTFLPEQPNVKCEDIWNILIGYYYLCCKPQNANHISKFIATVCKIKI